MSKKYIDCVCSSEEHVVRFIFDIDEDSRFSSIYLGTQLAPLPFFERVVAAIKYIFGYECKYGHWEETIIDLDAAKELRSEFDWFITSVEGRMNSLEQAPEKSSLIDQASDLVREAKELINSDGGPRGE